MSRSEPSETAGFWLLVGTGRRGALAGIGALLVVTLAVALASVLPRTILAGRPGSTIIWLFDGYVAVVLFVGMVFATVSGIAYGAYNGGPLLGFGLPVVPILTGNLLAGQFAVTVDLTIALCGGAAGAAVGTERLVVRTQKQWQPVASGIALSLGTFLLAGQSLRSLFGVVGVSHLGTVLSTVSLFVAGVAIGVVCVRVFVLEPTSGT